MMVKRRYWAPCFFLGTILLPALLIPVPASARQQDDEQLQSQPFRSEQILRDSNTVAEAQSQPEQKRADGQAAENHGPGAAQGPKNDRLFGIFPNYLTVENRAEVLPLTPREKFKLMSQNTFDPVIFPFTGFIALVNQGENDDPGYGQGAAGYGKRYGAALGDTIIGSFMADAFLPSVFKQDPRYFQLAHGGFKRRALYSISRTVITRSDSGHEQFNSSEVLGSFVAAGISNAYRAAQDRSFTNTLSAWGGNLGWDVITNVAQEFWPDVHRWIKQKF